jgi:pRiA4b ORF-3-like protein
MMTSATPLSLYQLRIVLGGISPLIWRCVLVRSETTLAHLHAILQILFAWSDEHLRRFHIHGKEYGSSGVQTRRVLLSDLQLHRGERFRYVYDVGAHWACDIRLEAIWPLAPRCVYPLCLGGNRAAPPEDC